MRQHPISIIGNPPVGIVSQFKQTFPTGNITPHFLTKFLNSRLAQSAGYPFSQIHILNISSKNTKTSEIGKSIPPLSAKSVIVVNLTRICIPVYQPVSPNFVIADNNHFKT
jgi:hypothetical protein